MASTNLSVDIDVRKVAKDIKVSVQLKKTFWLKLGLFFIKIGCRISGMGYVEEFPISLLDINGDPVEME